MVSPEPKTKQTLDLTFLHFRFWIWPGNSPIEMNMTFLRALGISKYKIFFKESHSNLVVNDFHTKGPVRMVPEFNMIR